MVQCHSLDRKRKTTMTDEKWMNVPITFPPVLAQDLSEEAFVVEAEVKGYLFRRIHIDEGASIEIIAISSDRERALTGRFYSAQKSTKEEQGCVRIGALGYDWERGLELEDVYKNINAACPKDYYPLPEINKKIESVIGFQLKCFIDAYKGYHQVQMAEEDEEKTTFYKDQGTYCYTKMMFGLKNAGATYQRLVDEAFQSQIGRNLEAYVDDMVVKSKSEKDMLADIAETFDNLRRINMKLNPKNVHLGSKKESSWDTWSLQKAYGLTQQRGRT
ncbi:reverse transcriptase domain-containing protein [Tanacetum coccineum]